MKRSTWIAIIVLGVLGGYIYWFEREPVDEAEGEVVFGVDESSVKRIEIRTPPGGEAPVVLERADEERGEEVEPEKEKEDAWRLTAPVAAEADGSEVDLLLQNLKTMRFQRRLEIGADAKLADFGLDPPKLEIRFETRDGSERSLSFGSDTPTTSNQYARRDGEKDVLVLASHLSLNFEKTAWDLRDKRVFPDAGDSEPDRIEIARPAGKLEIAKEGSLLYLDEPRSRADRDRVSSIAARIRGAEMREIASESPAGLEPYGLSEPSRRVRVELEGEDASLELEIGSAKDLDYYARTPSRPLVFLLPGDLVEELDTPVADLRSKKLFDYSVFEVERLRIEKKGSEVREIEKLPAGEEGDAEEKWRQTKPEPGRELDRTAVEDLLYALNGATAERVFEGPLTAEPELTVTVWSGNPEVEERILVAPVTETVRLMRGEESVSLELTKDAWSDVVEKLRLEPKE